MPDNAISGWSNRGPVVEVGAGGWKAARVVIARRGNERASRAGSVTLPQEIDDQTLKSTHWF